MENRITIDMIDDWAGAAMQGFLASTGPQKDLDLARITDLAYEAAVEMAKARGAFLERYGEELSPSESEEYED